MANKKISALALVAAASITAADITVMVDADIPTPTTYKTTLGQLRTALLTAQGTGWNSGSDFLSLGSGTAPTSGMVRAAQGAITADAPLINSTATWNAGAITFRHILVNITDTASAVDSLFADFQVGGVSKAKIDKLGNATLAGSLSAVNLTASGTLSVASTSALTGAVVIGTDPGGAQLLRVGGGVVGGGGVNVPITQRVQFNHGGTSYSIRVDAGGTMRFETNAADRMTLDPAGALTVSGTTTINGDTFVAMVGARAFYVATSVNTGVGAGDAVLANAKYWRGVNAAGTNTIALIGLNTSNQVQLDPGGVGTAVGGSLTVGAGITVSGWSAMSGPLAINPTLAAGTYALSVTGATGAARDIFLAGQSGFSNGFTVQYNGTAMVYTMANGALTVASGLTVSSGGATVAGTVNVNVPGAGAVLATNTTTNAATDYQYWAMLRGGTIKWRVGVNVNGTNVDEFNIYSEVSATTPLRITGAGLVTLANGLTLSAGTATVPTLAATQVLVNTPGAGPEALRVNGTIWTNTSALVATASGTSTINGGAMTLAVTGTGAASLTLTSVDTGSRNYALYSTSSTATIGAGKLGIYDVTGAAWRAYWDATGALTQTQALVVQAGGLQVTAGNIGIGSAPQANYGLVVAGSTLSGVNQYGIVSQPTFSSAATSQGVAGYFNLVTTAAAYTMATGYGVLIDVATKGAGSTITTQYGLYIANQNQGVTNYALYTNVGPVSLGDALTVRGGGASVTGGLTVATGDVTLSAATSRIIPGATSFAVRNNANNADNLLITDAGNATIRGSITVGGGATVSKFITTSISVSFTTVAAGSTSVISVTPVTGAAVGDAVYIDNPWMQNSLAASAWVDAANSVRIAVHNPTAAAITPPAYNVKIVVAKVA